MAAFNQPPRFNWLKVSVSAKKMSMEIPARMNCIYTILSWILLAYWSLSAFFRSSPRHRASTHYFPVSFPDFVSSDFILLRMIIAMSISIAMIGSLSLLLMSGKKPSNMTIPKAENKPTIMIILSICAFLFLFLRLGLKNRLLRQLNPSYPTPWLWPWSSYPPHFLRAALTIINTNKDSPIHVKMIRIYFLVLLSSVGLAVPTTSCNTLRSSFMWHLNKWLSGMLGNADCHAILKWALAYLIVNEY